MIVSQQMQEPRSGERQHEGATYRRTMSCELRNLGPKE
jgi:hypothetical protein